MSTSISQLGCDTFIYKQVEGTDIKFDLYAPSSPPSDLSRALAAVIYFHGGGLTVGTRRTWFPVWMKSMFAVIFT